jgi:hypothetical protein
MRLKSLYCSRGDSLILDAPCQLIKRPNELFWEDKFKACLDACEDNPILVIHADCTCDNWAQLVQSCIDANTRFKNIGVWAPQIEGTYMHLSFSRIFKIKNSSLNISALTDGIVFYLSPQIVRRMRKVKFGNNPLGWGIDGLFCAASNVMNKLVVIDEAVKVFHDQKRGYDTFTAKLMLDSFLNEYSPRERVEYELLRAYLKLQHSKTNVDIVI